MRRFVCLLFVLSFIILGCFKSRNDSLFSILNSSVCDYEIIEFCEDNQVVKINNLDLNKVFENLRLEFVDIYYCEGREIIEGYINKMSNYYVVNGRKINIQVSSFDGFSIIGYPMIKNSF